MIHKTAIIDPSAKIGEGTNVWAFAQIRENVSIGKCCTIGNGSYIDKGVQIGDNVKLMNKVLVHRGVRIEEDVFLGPMVCFVNDKNPRHDQERDLTRTEWRVRKGASIGAGVLIMPDINIGRYSLVGAGSIVTKDIPDHGLVYGSPANLKGFICFCGRKLSINKSIESDDKIKLICSHCQKEIFIKKEDFQILI